MSRDVRRGRQVQRVSKSNCLLVREGYAGRRCGPAAPTDGRRLPSVGPTQHVERVPAVGTHAAKVPTLPLPACLAQAPTLGHGKNRGARATRRLTVIPANESISVLVLQLPVDVLLHTHPQPRSTSKSK